MTVYQQEAGLIKVKKFTQSEVDKIRVCSEQLRSIPGIDAVITPVTVSDLYMHGGAYIMVPINTVIANEIWEISGISKDHELSGYPRLIASKDIHLSVTLYKSGRWFDTFYLGNSSITFSGSQVDIGCIAEKKIPFVINRIAELLMLKKPIPSSTKDAICKMQ